MKIDSLSGHPKCFFIKTDLEKFSFTSLSHQWMLYSVWVPSESESKQLIKHHNKSTRLQSSINILWIKSCAFVRNKSIKMFLTSNCLFQLKYELFINIIAFSGVKVVLSKSGERYAATMELLLKNLQLFVSQDIN